MVRYAIINGLASGFIKISGGYFIMTILSKSVSMAILVPTIKVSKPIGAVLVGRKNPTTTDPIKIFDTSAK